jgi:hypothetical protein
LKFPDEPILSLSWNSTKIEANIVAWEIFLIS